MGKSEKRKDHVKSKNPSLLSKLFWLAVGLITTIYSIYEIHQVFQFRAHAIEVTARIDDLDTRGDDPRTVLLFDLDNQAIRLTSRYLRQESEWRIGDYISVYITVYDSVTMNAWPLNTSRRSFIGWLFPLGAGAFILFIEVINLTKFKRKWTTSISDTFHELTDVTLDNVGRGLFRS